MEQTNNAEKAEGEAEKVPKKIIDDGPETDAELKLKEETEKAKKVQSVADVTPPSFCVIPSRRRKALRRRRKRKKTLMMRIQACLQRQ